MNEIADAPLGVVQEAVQLAIKKQSAEAEPVDDRARVGCEEAAEIEHSECAARWKSED